MHSDLTCNGLAPTPNRHIACISAEIGKAHHIVTLTCPNQTNGVFEGQGQLAFGLRGRKGESGVFPGGLPLLQRDSTFFESQRGSRARLVPLCGRASQASRIMGTDDKISICGARSGGAQGRREERDRGIVRVWDMSRADNLSS